jgi:predicted nucleic acid-binding protein
MKPPAAPAQFQAALDAIRAIRTVTPDGVLFRRAVEIHELYGIHFCDGMIVAAAERAECRRIWSEDLNSGQRYLGIVVENPFA